MVTGVCRVGPRRFILLHAVYVVADHTTEAQFILGEGPAHCPWGHLSGVLLIAIGYRSTVRNCGPPPGYRSRRFQTGAAPHRQIPARLSFLELLLLVWWLSCLLALPAHIPLSCVKSPGPLKRNLWSTVAANFRDQSRSASLPSPLSPALFRESEHGRHPVPPRLPT